MVQEMKITVCFGTTKIIVPCGTQLPVRELIQQAIVRYKKVTNKHSDDYIRVHCLQTCEEEAILDEDDTVGDVLDDKDKVIASFEENLVSRPGNNGGDGTSTSSVGTASPDIFQGDQLHAYQVEGIPISDGQYSKMTEFNNNPPSSLVTYVQGFSPHGSTGNMNSIKNDEGIQPYKNRGILEGRSFGSDIEGYEGIMDNCSDNEENDISAFKRESARKSLKSDHLDRWIDMQESYSEFKRLEPTGAPPSPSAKSASESVARVARQISLALSEPDDTEHLNIVLKPTMGENLGIIVQGYKTADERELGLIVFKIDPKGCAARDGRVQVADRIVAVNSQDLTNFSNERAAEAFNKALQCDTIELGISRSHSFIPESQPVIKSKRTSVASSKEDSDSEAVIEEGKNTVSPLPNFNSTPYLGEVVSPRNKTESSIPRIMEKKIFIELQKGSDGLGFSVTSRDNPAGGNCPIYVKNILPYGAAIRDGRLQAGDQLIQVDGVEMTGKTQEKAVTILRSTNGHVKLKIQRKVTITSPIGSKTLIKDIERAPSDSRGNKILTYRISLPSSGTAGLGITIKGKSSTVEKSDSGVDLGIFVKTIVPGGAAQQDGRLNPHDQLISVNGVKLTGMSNSSALKTLRSAMEGETLDSVEVTVIRSVKEILNNVTELKTNGAQINNSDRAIDVGGIGEDSSSKDQGKDVLDGAMSKIKEDEPTCLPTIPNKDDEITELKSSRKPIKLGNGVHRNPSYYIAMNRSGQRGERPKVGRPLPKSLFYRPKEDSPPIAEQTTENPRPLNDEKPKIVIASYTHAAQVSTATRTFCISSRPSSTVAEPTSSMSTRSSRSSEAENPSHKTLPSPDPTRTKRPPASLSIPKGIPPPPPPRTSRPSPYAKQFPNYLPANALRKTDSTFSDFSDNSEVISALQSSRGNTSDVKILSATEVKKENKEDVKKNVLVAKESVDSTPGSDHHVMSDNLTDDESREEPFLREGFGRQSMSEKRFKLAQVDITQTEFYKSRVKRSKSLEGDIEITVVPSESKTLPRQYFTSNDKEPRLKARHDYNKSNNDIPKHRSKDSSHSKTVSAETSFDPNNVRGQWRTSSDGVVKKYRHRHRNHGHSSLTKAKNMETNVTNTDASMGSGDEPIPITMQSNADYNSVHPKVKKKQSPFKVLGAALKPKAHKGKYDMQTRIAPESPSETRVELPDEQRYRQLVLGETLRGGRRFSETLLDEKIRASSDSEDMHNTSRRRKAEQNKRTSPVSLQEFLRKGSGEYSITESAQI